MSIDSDDLDEPLSAVSALLRFVGEDPKREGLAETPYRFIMALREYTSGYRTDPVEVLKTFEDGAQSYDEMVLVGPLPFHSLCEHHLAPFFGEAYIGYLPKGRIVGLSKFARLVEGYARRLQVQERLTRQVGDAIQDALDPLGVGVVMQARHMCMEARGVRKPGVLTTTSALYGDMKYQHDARSEFLAFVRASRRSA